MPLSPYARHESYNELGTALPKPVTHARENYERRLNTAIDAFEALRPGDAFEARLAVQIVLCGAHAADSLREANLYGEDFPKLTRCRAQAASMMREERAAWRMLTQMQKQRLAVEAVAGTAPAQPASPPPPQPVETHAPPPPIQATAAATPPTPPPAPPRPVAPTSARQPVTATTAPPPTPEAIVEAEIFVLQDIEAAAQIRRDRGVTPQTKVHSDKVALPADPIVIDALIRGSSKILDLLDDKSFHTAA